MDTQELHGVDFYRAAIETMGSLYWRWQDEKEYEDLAEYIEAFRSLATTHGVELIEMTKRPFGVKYKADGHTYHMTSTSKAASLTVCK